MNPDLWIGEGSFSSFSSFLPSFSCSYSLLSLLIHDSNLLGARSFSCSSTLLSLLIHDSNLLGAPMDIMGWGAPGPTLDPPLPEGPQNPRPALVTMTIHFIRKANGQFILVG
jgi:hypothetical protein